MVGFGEVLWDIFPDGRRLGGAPFNFVFHGRALGLDSAPVTRVGDDDLGREILRRAEEGGVPTAGVQRDDRHPTGTVRVELDGAGSPTFTIERDVAWDWIEYDAAAADLARAADWICFGTLAQRAETSRETLNRVLADAPAGACRLCDLNLRAPHDDPDVVEASLSRCDVLKLNDDEAAWIGKRWEWPRDAAEVCARLRDAYGIDQVYVTLGAEGCLASAAGGEFHVPGERVDVVDTVGAGDAFAAGLVARLADGAGPAGAARFANRLGAFVAACRGATPSIEPFLRAEPDRVGRSASS